MMAESYTEKARTGGQTGRILITAGCVAAVLAAILLLNPGEGQTEEAAGTPLNQAATSGPGEAPPAAVEELPGLWLQAYGSPGGNGAWAPAVTAPFDTLWTLSTGREIFSPPAVVGDHIYIAGNDKVLRGLNRHDGSQLWSRTVTCGVSGGIAADSQKVYFSGQDGYLYAINRDTGSEEWKAGLGYHIFTDAAVLADSMVLAGNSMGSIAALSTASGEVLWDDSMEGLVIGPAVLDTVAVFCTESGEAAAWDHNGNRLWSRSFTTQPSPPSISSGKVYIGFSSGKVLALSLNTGETLWETSLDGVHGRAVVTRPAVAGDTLLVAGTCDGRVFCLKASDGSFRWETGMENWVAVTPAVCERTVYASCDDGRIHLLSLDDGTPLDTLETGTYSGTPPLIIQGVLYVGTAAGDFNAISGSEPESDGTEDPCPVE